MVGLGETDEEILEVLADLRRADVDIVTLGQYLRPTRDHVPVARYVTPGGFRRPRARGPRPRHSHRLLRRLRPLLLQCRGSGGASRRSACRRRVSFDQAPYRRDALAALSGVLLVLSFPKFGHGAVAWVALAPLLMALPGAQGWTAFRLGYVTGALSALGLLYWTALVVIQYGGLSLPVGVVVMVLLCLAVALFPALFAWLVGRWVAAHGLRGLLFAPFAWVATEVLRAYTTLPFPVVPARLQPAPSPSLHPDRVGHGGLRSLVPARGERGPPGLRRPREATRDGAARRPRASSSCWPRSS